MEPSCGSGGYDRACGCRVESPFPYGPDFCRRTANDLPDSTRTSRSVRASSDSSADTNSACCSNINNAAPSNFKDSDIAAGFARSFAHPNSNEFARYRGKQQRRNDSPHHTGECSPGKSATSFHTNHPRHGEFLDLRSGRRPDRKRRNSDRPRTHVGPRQPRNCRAHRQRRRRHLPLEWPGNPRRWRRSRSQNICLRRRRHACRSGKSALIASLNALLQRTKAGLQPREQEARPLWKDLRD